MSEKTLIQTLEVIHISAYLVVSVSQVEIILKDTVRHTLGRTLINVAIVIRLIQLNGTVPYT